MNARTANRIFGNINVPGPESEKAELLAYLSKRYPNFQPKQYKSAPNPENAEQNQSKDVSQV